jgi:chaperonin GroEL
MNERKDRVDDALNATKAAIEEGILPGGGVALARATQWVESNGNDDFNFGVEIVKTACKKPFEQILSNAGYNSTAIDSLTKELDGDDWTGYDIKQDKMVDFKEAGIIDPFKVTRSALQNASSIAGTILLTEATVVDKPAENNQPQMDPSMMGMM